MSTFSEVMTEASTMLDSGEIDATLLGDIALEEIFTEVAGLISQQLMHLSGLGDDAEANETAMRQVMQTAAVKAFFAGLMIGQATSSDDGVVLTVDADELQAAAVEALRTGALSITLISG